MQEAQPVQSEQWTCAEASGVLPQQEREPQVRRQLLVGQAEVEAEVPLRGPAQGQVSKRVWVQVPQVEVTDAGALLDAVARCADPGSRQ